MFDTKTADALCESLSRERLSKYLSVTEDRLSDAIALYEINTKLSAAFYVPLQSLEICLRNHLNRCMSSRYGENWLLDPISTPMSAHSREMLDLAIRESGSQSPGKVVAELKFAFWVGLLAQQYDATIWRQAAHHAFRAHGGKQRKPVHSRMNAIRRFRNRVAHHEPIFQADPLRTHGEILEAIGWMCPITAEWTRSNSREVEALAAACPI
jgi:hypothetical protein